LTGARCRPNRFAWLSFATPHHEKKDGDGENSSDAGESCLPLDDNSGALPILINISFADVQENIVAGHGMTYAIVRSGFRIRESFEGESFYSNSRTTISGFDPSRSGGPQVPAPLEVKTCIFPMRLRP
jgi:hypothetical protein